MRHRAYGRVAALPITLLLVAALPTSLVVGTNAASAKNKKLSLAEVAALEWKLEQATTTLTRSLKDSERRKAVAELAKFSDPRVVRPLATALKEDPSAKVRLDAAKALASITTPEAKGTLTLASKSDPAPDVRAAAKQGLAKMPRRLGVAKVPISPQPVASPKGKLSGASLAQMMRQPAGGSRIWAIGKIARMKFSGREALLKKHLLEDPSSRVRVKCAEVLGDGGDKQALRTLIQAAADGDPAVRFAIARALAEHDDPGALAALQRLASDDADPTVRAEAKDLLEPNTPVGRRLLSQRIKLLGSANPGTRVKALEALSGFTHWRAMKPMSCTLLADRSATVRTAAARALSNMHDASVLSALRVAALIEPDAKQKKTVRALLGDLRRQVDLLIKQLQSKDPTQRVLAARALGQAAYPQGLNPLIGKVKDSDPRVRRAVVRALENFDNPQAVDALRVAAGDHDKVVRQLVDRFFKRQSRLKGWRKFFGDTNRLVTKTLDKSPVWRADAAIALGVAGADSASTNLIQLLIKDPDERVRLAAAWSLVLMASSDSERALKTAAAKDKSQKVRLAARKYLVIEKVSVDDLIRQLHDPKAAARQDAAEALSLRTSGPVVYHLVQAAMCDPAPEVRSVALRGLARVGKPLARTVIRVARERDTDPHVKRVAMIMDFLSGGKRK